MASSEAALILRYFGRYTASAAGRAMSASASTARAATMEARASVAPSPLSTMSASYKDIPQSSQPNAGFRASSGPSTNSHFM